MSMPRLASARIPLVYILLCRALSSGFVVMQVRSGRRRETQQNPEQCLTRLRKAYPDWHILEVTPGRPDLGFYISTQPRELQELLALIRDKAGRKNNLYNCDTTSEA
jgi:hypothetical protein